MELFTGYTDGLPAVLLGGLAELCSVVHATPSLLPWKSQLVMGAKLGLTMVYWLATTSLPAPKSIWNQPNWPPTAEKKVLAVLSTAR